MTRLPSEFLKRPIAHRALHDVTSARPENSRAAIRAAIDKGYSIEIDVQLSADGQAMVFHDYHLGRLTERTGAFGLNSAKDLAQVRLKGSDEAIPTLVEILALIDGQVPLLVEIKEETAIMGPNVGRLEQSLAQALAAYEGLVAIMSFSPHSVEAIGRLLPDVPRGLVTGAFPRHKWTLLPAETRDQLRQIPDYDRLGCCFISHDVNNLDTARVAELKDRRASILCWTVRSAKQEAKARRMADNVTFEGYLPG